MLPVKQIPASGPREDVSGGMTVTWIGAAVNISLAMIKVVTGIKAHSQALVADGIHSLSDLFTDFVVLLGLRWGRQAEDRDHPFGHGRIETMAGLIVGIVLMLVAVGIGHSAVDSILEDDRSTPGVFAIVVAAVSIVSKEWLYQYTVRVGKRIRSHAMVANAWHHRSDALSSVAVLIGVTAAYVNPAWHKADAYAALAVCVFILKVGIRLSWEATKEVVDTAPDPAMIERFRTMASRVDGVRGVHDLRARYSGADILIEVHIEVDPDLSVQAGHEIASRVKYGLEDGFTEVKRVIVHVDPSREG